MTPRQQAQEAVNTLKQIILDYLANHPEGATCSELARDLGLESNVEGRSINYLPYSILGLLANDGRVQSQKVGKNRFYHITRLT